MDPYVIKESLDNLQSLTEFSKEIEKDYNTFKN